MKRHVLVEEEMNINSVDIMFNTINRNILWKVLEQSEILYKYMSYKTTPCELFCGVGEAEWLPIPKVSDREGNETRIHIVKIIDHL